MDFLAGAASKAVDVGKDMGKGISQNLGNIEKAIIEIIDARGQELQENDADDIQGGGLGGLADNSFLGSAGALDVLESSNNLGAIAGNFAGGLEGLLDNASVKRYTVQFNPSSLSIKGRGKGFMPIQSYGQDGNLVTNPASQTVRITVSVKLIIDQVDPFDAFMADKLNVSPTQLGQNVAKAIKGGIDKKKGKSKITVQDTVEAFIATLRSPYTRTITFHWGNMNYSGVLNGCSAQYVMFNTKGQPIRAYINLTLLCLHEDAYANSLGPWQAAYKKAFGVDSLDLTSGAQKVGNLINF